MKNQQTLKSQNTRDSSMVTFQNRHTDSAKGTAFEDRGSAEERVSTKTAKPFTTVKHHTTAKPLSKTTTVKTPELVKHIAMVKLPARLKFHQTQKPRTLHHIQL